MPKAVSATSPGDRAIDLLVDLVGAEAIDPDLFHHRLCAAICRLTRLERAMILLYDPAYRAVRPVGWHGVEPDLARHLKGLEGTLDEAPVARRVLESDDIEIVSGNLAEHIPARFSEGINTHTLVCAPVSAAGRWLGVVFGDCNGRDFELDEGERRPLRTLGRAAALVAGVEHSTSQRARADQLNERIALTREIHDQVIQRLFGLSLVLGTEGDLSAADRARAHDEVRRVLADLRGSLDRSLAPPERETKVTLRHLLDRMAEHDERLRVRWARGLDLPARLEPLAQSVVAEALRNADKHASAVTLEVEVFGREGALVLEVVNDGAAPGARNGGLGLRLAAIEALRHEGVVEYGPLPGQRWRVRLVCPLAEEAGDDA